MIETLEPHLRSVQIRALRELCVKYISSSGIRVKNYKLI